jgi:hypothetical protein
MEPQTGMIVKFIKFRGTSDQALGVLTISGLPGPVLGFSPNVTHWRLGTVSMDLAHNSLDYPRNYKVQEISFVDDPSFKWSASQGFIVLGKRADVFNLHTYEDFVRLDSTGGSIAMIKQHGFLIARYGTMEPMAYFTMVAIG